MLNAQLEYLGSLDPAVTAKRDRVVAEYAVYSLGRPADAQSLGHQCLTMTRSSTSIRSRISGRPPAAGSARADEQA